jgi:hypothetical protein
MVNEYPVPAVGHVEGDVLVRLLAGRAAVGVPHVDRLAVLDQRAEALTQPVHELADPERELLCGQREGEERTVERVAAVTDHLVGREHDQGVAGHADLVRLAGVDSRHAAAYLPEAVRELHARSSGTVAASAGL